MSLYGYAETDRPIHLHPEAPPMGRPLDSISAELQAFIEAQPVFFVATAPLDPAGHVNLSPKGLDSFRVLGPGRVAYLDLTGSGNETSAHLRENGRVTFMFCSFSGPPRILRIYGRGRTALPGSTEWSELAGRFEAIPGARQIIVADVERVSTSCGYGVPLMESVGERDTLQRWAAEKEKKGGLARYRRAENVRSIDGLLTPLGDLLGPDD